MAPGFHSAGHPFAARTIAMLGIVTAAAVVAGCAPTALPVPPMVATPTPAPTCAEQTFNAMTPRQRVGQLFMVGARSAVGGDADALISVRDDSVGGVVLSEQGWQIANGSAEVTRLETARMQSGGLRSPSLFIAANQEGGYVQQVRGLGVSDIPQAILQGAFPSTVLRNDATLWAKQLRAAGVNLNLAPVADVVPDGVVNQADGALGREYGHDPPTVTRAIDAVIAGMRDGGVATTVKHFPGLGMVQANTDFSNSGVVDTVTTRTSTSLDPFRSAISHDHIGFVMVALATYTQLDPQNPAALSPAIIGGLLRRDLGFTGVVVSDALGAAALQGIPMNDRVVRFFAAGGDVAILEHSSALEVHAAVAAVLARSARQPAFAAAVNRSTLRVLTAKQAMGLLGC